jgi:hypothetical protein
MNDTFPGDLIKLIKPKEVIFWQGREITSSRNTSIADDSDVVFLVICTGLTDGTTRGVPMLFLMSDLTMGWVYDCSIEFERLAPA